MRAVPAAVTAVTAAQPIVVLLLLMALLLPASACSDDDSSTTSTAADTGMGQSDTEPTSNGGSDTDTLDDVEPDTPSDDEPPSLRDIRIEVTGEFGDAFDLNDTDGTLLLPVDTPVEVTVFGQDNMTSADTLTVDVVDARTDQVRTVEDRSFRNGLWRLTVLLGPDTETRIRVTDEAGNTIESPAVLRVPSLEEQLVGAWKRPQFALDQQVISQADMALRSDGTWSISEDGLTGFEGTWTRVEEMLWFEETALPAEVSRAQRHIAAPLYVDAFYFSIAPYTRTAGEGTDAAGTWTLTEAIVTGPTSGGFEDALMRTTTLDLSADDTWTETITEGSEPVQTSSGTWQVEINEDYVESLGDFLVRQVQSIDGEPLDEPQMTIELFDIRADRLLRSPFVRIEE